MLYSYLCRGPHILTVCLLNTSSPKQGDTPNSACTMGFWRNKSLVDDSGQRAPPRTRKMLKKQWVFKHFQKKMVLALEFGAPPFHFSTNALANIVVFVVKVVWPHNSASSVTWRPRAPNPKMIPKSSQNDPKKIPKWWSSRASQARLEGPAYIYM